MRLRLTLTLALLSLGTLAMAQEKIVRYDDSVHPVIAAKGSWIVGGTAGFTGHDNANYSFAVISGINSVGFHVSVAPEFCWFLQDNLGFGAKVSYGRSMLDAASGSLDFGSISLGVKDYYTISQDLGLTAFMRYYIPIADSERIAMYVDAGLQGVWGHSKESDEHTGAVVGTWQDKWKVGIVVNPGIMAYFSKHVAVFASLGMAGLGYGKVSQVHNQVDAGHRGSFSMSYMLDLTSLNIGLDFYLGKR